MQATTTPNPDQNLNTESPTFLQDNLWELITEKIAADFLGVSPRALQGWRLSGRGPPFIKISSRCVRYRKVNLIEWSSKQLRSSTSDQGNED